MTPRRRFTIRMLLIGVNLSVLLVPVGALVFSRVFEAYLLRQTERQLIAESVVIGEVYRERLREAGAAGGGSVGDSDDAAVGDADIRPPGRADDRFTPHQPLLALGFDLSPEPPQPPRRRAGIDSPAVRAGVVLGPLLRRAQVFNLSGARVLDAEGCIVATSGDDRDVCLEAYAEVRDALRGRYAAVARVRHTDEPAPPVGGIRRRGRLRVFTATPVFDRGSVVGVVRMSRTAVSPAELLWSHRGKVGLVAVVVLLFTPVLSYAFSHAISKPVRDLTRAAESMADGAARREFTPGRTAPREVLILSEALNRMTSQLTEQRDYILEFARNVSHELKTPITGITGAIELLQDEWEQMPEAQRRRFLDNMAGDAARIESLAHDLLRLARIESVPEPAEDIALGDFVERFVRRHGDAVVLERATPDPRVAIHRGHLETALHNLLDNALRHGAGRPVTVRTAHEHGRPVLYVRDRGPGISVANRPRIFERFFTTERERGGTGLGLAIVKAVAETRGGSVAFRTDDTGTEFRLVL